LEGGGRGECRNRCARASSTVVSLRWRRADALAPPHLAAPVDIGDEVKKVKAQKAKDALSFALKDPDVRTLALILALVQDGS